MPTTPDATAVAVRLRRLWLTDVRRSEALLASDLADAAGKVSLRRVDSRLVVRGAYDFGSGDPFAGDLGDLLRARAERLSGGAVHEVVWQHDPAVAPLKDRARSTALDVHDPGDPPPAEWAAVLDRLRAAVPPSAPDPAREVLGRLRLVAVSRHRLWFAAPNLAARQDLGAVVGARAALVTAVQRVQRAEVPLYGVVVDPTYRAARDLLTTTTS